MYLVLLSLLITTSLCQVPLRIITPDLKSANIFPNNGSITCLVDLSTQLPTPADGCKWQFPLVGTRGQTSTVFYVNQTSFFTGQEVCPDGVRQTVIFASMGPFCWDPNNPTVRVGPLYKIDTTVDITELNMAWDHACNVAILQPMTYPNGTMVISTKQVSDYDGQVRPQKDYVLNNRNCVTCRRKVPGFGGLDFGDWSPNWNPELNCGDLCLFYSLEEQVVNGKAILPRAIIGRSFRTDTLYINITDSIQAQTMSWNPYVNWQVTQKNAPNQFIGIGVCCSEAWCHADCKNLDSHLVLFSFTPYQTEQIRILADIGAEYDPVTVRLGVEYSQFFIQPTDPHYIYVWYHNTIITYTGTVDTGTGVFLSATYTSKSPTINSDIVMWSPGMSY